MSDSFLRLPTVKARTGLSESAIYRLMRKRPPEFPLKVPLGPNTTGWSEHEIDEYVENRKKARENRYEST